MSFIRLCDTNRFSCYELYDPNCRNIYVDLCCKYTRRMLLKILKMYPEFCIVRDYSQVENIKGAVQFSDFESIVWEDVLGEKHHSASSYLVRKGLSRKAQFASQLRRFCAKNKASILNRAVPETHILDTWGAFESKTKVSFGSNVFADFGDSFSSIYFQQIPLRNRMSMVLEGTEIKDVMDRENCVWIMKPSVTNKGLNILLLRTYDELVESLVENSDMREWVLQRYIDRPLLINNKKFHIRVYVLAVGALSVYVYNDMLLLIAAHSYDMKDLSNIFQHLTNTARSVEDDSFIEAENVKMISEMPELLQRSCGINVSAATAEAISVEINKQIHEITRDIFAAFENEYTVFAPMTNCFELYGVDFMVELSNSISPTKNDVKVSILEVNPGPDFKQTGDRLSLVIEGLLRGTCELALRQDKSVADSIHSRMDKKFTLVYDKEWSVSKIAVGMSLK